jgi:hypothetical protein
VAHSTTTSTDSPPRGIPMPLRSRLTLVVVPFATLVTVLMLIAVLEPELHEALGWFRTGLTAAAIGACVTVVVIVLDKHRWAQEAFSEAIAEAVDARNRVAEATVMFEYQLNQARMDAARQIDALMREVSEQAAFAAIVQTSPPRLKLHSSDGAAWTKEG